MSYPKSLFLYEEIMLLALRNESGTIAANYTEYVVAGAVLAELLLDRRIAVDATRKQLVDLLEQFMILHSRTIETNRRRLRG